MHFLLSHFPFSLLMSHHFFYYSFPSLPHVFTFLSSANSSHLNNHNSVSFRPFLPLTNVSTSWICYYLQFDAIKVVSPFRWYLQGFLGCRKMSFVHQRSEGQSLSWGEGQGFFLKGCDWIYFIVTTILKQTSFSKDWFLSSSSFINDLGDKLRLLTQCWFCWWQKSNPDFIL